VYVEGRGYVPVSELHNGDRLRTPDGSLVEVVSIQATGKTEMVYNFTVGGTNSYFVSDGVRCVLVHNSCTWESKASRWRDTSNGRFVARPTSPSELVNIKTKSIDFNDVQQWASQGNLQNTWKPNASKFASGGFRYTEGDTSIWGHGANPSANPKWAAAHHPTASIANQTTTLNFRSDGTWGSFSSDQAGAHIELTGSPF
jgi:hypothetical protein